MYQKQNFKENYLLHFDIYPACNQSSNFEAVPNHFYCCIITILSQISIVISCSTSQKGEKVHFD